MEIRKFVDQVAIETKGDYSQAFKLLGFVIFLTEEGTDPILSGNLISNRTYHRWMDSIERAGWGDLIADARLRKEIQKYLWSRFAGLPITMARNEIINTVRSMLGEVEAFPLQAESPQESEAVKGERSETNGHEAKSSALDGGANGGSLSKVETPKL